MAQNFSFSMEQSQKMAAQQIQALEIVTLSTDELREKIKKEAETNPAIRVTEGDASFEAYSSRYSSGPSFSDEANSSDYSDGDDSSSSWFEKVVTERESLEEHLLSELGCLELDENVRRTAEEIITSLDPHGFTGPDPRNGVPERDWDYVEDAVKAVQLLEPTGVGAKDWKGAIMLQIKEIEHDSAEIQRYRDIIYRGLDYIKDGKLDQLAKALKISRADLDNMLAVIKTLTPFPGLKYSSDYTNYAIPELSIKVKNGKIVMRVLKGLLPEIDVDDEYKEMRSLMKGSSSQKEKEASKYLSDSISSAETLVNLLKLRENTLEKIGLFLAEKQEDFFLQGPLFMKGLTMTETADSLGIAISTVSKIAQAKYVDTDWGIFPLRYFFSSEVKKEDGGDLSKNSVKLMIKKIIDSNTSAKALSDQKISDKLAEMGIQVARRTVAKYRSEMDLDASYGKKQG
ncbi:MAG: RNA polymerase factor sigma-54 [Spirochaetales bacterium]|nr:RNA polymerase factor sigma-54 [Candidatus Physcosoma equi]